jgi:HEAT repeat protein
MIKSTLCSLLLCAAPLIASEAERGHIGYLLQCNQVEEALKAYQENRKAAGKHDFEALEQLAHLLLNQSARSVKPQEQLLSMFGSGLAAASFPLEVLEAALSSTDPQLQLVSIQLLHHLQDDRSDELLAKAMNSEFLFCRMEAAYALSLRKHKKATGQIEALMYRLPPEFKAYFPQFFAMIGTSDASKVLRRLMEDGDPNVRIEAILHAAQGRRDDFLPLIRSLSTHSHIAQQEVCAAAFGILNDSKSVARLERFAKSTEDSIALAADRALLSLGNTKARERIIAHARKQNLFAISLLAEIKESEPLLAELVKSEQPHVRINAAIALLRQRSPLCLPALYEILIPDARDFGLMPQFSAGKALTAWKVLPSLQQRAALTPFDLGALSLSIREHLLAECLELPESHFVAVAQRIFASKQIDLIPLLVSLLQNLQTKEAISLLQKRAQTAGVPLMRVYCNLALYKLKNAGPHAEALKEWIKAKKSTELIRFRPLLPWNMRAETKAGSMFELTPEESSRLLIEAYQALADEHEEDGIDILLDSIQTGHVQNRCVLAGLLLRAIQ